MGGQYELFSDDKEQLTWMVNDISVELLDLDMEPKPESLWWTSIHEGEDEGTRKVGRSGESRDLPLVERSSGYPFPQDWDKGFRERKRRRGKEWEVGGGMGTLGSRRGASLRRKCDSCE